MFKLTVKYKKVGKDTEDWMREVFDIIYPEVQDELRRASEATARLMRRIILSAYPRATALANAIQSEILVDAPAHLEIGIGRISDLPKDEQGRDYYNAFNDGWLPPPNFGYWEPWEPPMKGVSGGKWVHTGISYDFYMQPKNPIQPLRYIDIGFETFTKHIDTEIARLMRKIEQAGK